jgi:hypothetical protein
MNPVNLASPGLESLMRRILYQHIYTKREEAASIVSKANTKHRVEAAGIHSVRDPSRERSSRFPTMVSSFSILRKVVVKDCQKELSN